MTIRYTVLFFYQCRSCRTIATTPAKATTTLRCNLCRSYLRLLYVQPITTAAEQALAARGLVYNPHAPTEVS
jgi:hypothetical protein